MITDQQVRILRRLERQGVAKEVAAARVGMDAKTARKYRRLGKLPSEVVSMDRNWRTRPDPFAEVWPEIEARLQVSAGLEASACDLHALNTAEEYVAAIKKYALVSLSEDEVRKACQDAWAKALDYSIVPLDLAKSIYASSRDGNMYYARLHYEGSHEITFVHSETGLRTLKDEFDKIVSHNRHHVADIKKALQSSSS
jgi:hypothetical protein